MWVVEGSSRTPHAIRFVRLWDIANVADTLKLLLLYTRLWTQCTICDATLHSLYVMLAVLVLYMV